jgi:hypothetical protein
VQDTQETSIGRYPLWLYLASVAIGMFAVLFFFQTRDPMILIFGIILAAMLWLAMYFARAPNGFRGTVMLRCGSCRGLNPESAKFCNQCGKGL